MLRFQEALDAIIIQKASDESRIRSPDCQKSAARCEITGRFSLGRAKPRPSPLGLNEKAQLSHRRQERDRCLQGAGHCVYHSWGILIRSRKRIAGRADAIAKLVLLAKYGRYNIHYRGCKTEIEAKVMSKTMSHPHGSRQL